MSARTCAAEAAKELLLKAGYKAREVFCVWSAGESDLGAETILYVTPAGDPRTATITDHHVRVFNGW